MNANIFIAKDYENEPPSGSEKTNPIKACPERSRMGQFQMPTNPSKERERKKGFRNFFRVSVAGNDILLFMGNPGLVLNLAKVHLSVLFWSLMQ